MSNGPSETSDLNWVKLFNKLRINGHTILGYVDTAYSTRSISTVQEDVALWQSLYDISDIFFDQVGEPLRPSKTKVSNIMTYYTTLLSGIRSSIPNARIILNCGAVPPSRYFKIDNLTEIVVFEDTWESLKTKKFPISLNKYWNRLHLIVNSAPANALSIVNDFANAKTIAGYFVTDQTTENYSVSLPSYLLK